MRWSCGDAVPNRWLTPLQEQVLETFFSADAGRGFYLTGGTALAAFHLHHRRSVDLDLFTLDDLAFAEAVRQVPLLAAQLGCELRRARHTQHYAQFLLGPAGGEALQVDLVLDFGPQYGDYLRAGVVIVDSVVNIGANKLTAILGRCEPKDFVDLYFILQAGLDFDDLFAKAQSKDLGMLPFYMAGALLQMRTLHQLPATSPPVTLEMLKAALSPLANRLLERSEPASREAPDQRGR
jgi:hypothetical protein